MRSGNDDAHFNHKAKKAKRSRLNVCTSYCKFYLFLYCVEDDLVVDFVRLSKYRIVVVHCKKNQTNSLRRMNNGVTNLHSK